MDGKAHSISRRTLLLSGASLLPLIRPLRAQQSNPPGNPQENPTFSAGVKVVSVLATVRNGKGDIVRNLTKDEFEIEEDNRLQKITYFAQETNLPLTLGLLVDTSGSQRRVLDQEKNASRDFFQHVLRPDQDQAFLIHFDREVELLQDLTSSRDKLESAINTMDRPQLQRGNTGNNGGGSGNGGGYPSGQGGGGGYPTGQGGGRGRGGYPQGGRGGGGTALYDAVFLAADEVTRKQTGRKALILLSDGVDNGSRTSLTSAIESAQRSDTLIYSILFADEDAYGGGARPSFGGGGPFGGPGLGGGRRGGGRRAPVQQRPDGKKILERISKETGGALFEVSKKHPLDDIYDQIEVELRNQYSLGYSSDRTDSSGGYRKIHITTKQKGLVVQARDGYYAS